MPQEIITFVLVFSTNNSDKEAKIKPEEQRGISLISISLVRFDGILWEIPNF